MENDLFQVIPEKFSFTSKRKSKVEITYERKPKNVDTKH